MYYEVDKFLVSGLYKDFKEREMWVSLEFAFVSNGAIFHLSLKNFFWSLVTFDKRKSRLRMAFVMNLTTSWFSSSLMRLGVTRDRSFHVIRPWGTWNSFIDVQDRRLIDFRDGERWVMNDRSGLLLKSCYCFICQIASFRSQYRE